MQMKAYMKRTGSYMATTRLTVTVICLLLLLVVSPLYGRRYDMAIVPDSNVNLAGNIRDILNAAGGNVTNEVITFFQTRARHNMWNKFKPVAFSKPFTENFPTWYKGDNGQFGYEFIWCKGNEVSRYAYEAMRDSGKLKWSYILPGGGEYQPFRLSDFKGYDTTCSSPFVYMIPSKEYSTEGEANSLMTLGFSVSPFFKAGNFKPDELEIDGNQCATWYPGLVFLNSSGEMVAIVTLDKTMSEEHTSIIHYSQPSSMPFAPQLLKESGDYTTIFIMSSKRYYGSGGYYKLTQGAFSDNDVYFAFFPCLPGTLTLINPGQLFIHPQVHVSESSIVMNLFATNLTDKTIYTPVINVSIDYRDDRAEGTVWNNITSWNNLELERGTIPANSSNFELVDEYITYMKNSSWPTSSWYRVTIEGVEPKALGDDEVLFKDNPGSVWD